MLIQWSDEDDVFITTLPEFHGCRTHGETYEEAAKNGREVLELLIEDFEERSQSLPKPRKFDSTACA
jgi:predicted RNase H-like HicB family nuclease